MRWAIRTKGERGCVFSPSKSRAISFSVQYVNVAQKASTTPSAVESSRVGLGGGDQRMSSQSAVAGSLECRRERFYVPTHTHIRTGMRHVYTASTSTMAWEYGKGNGISAMPLRWL